MRGNASVHKATAREDGARSRSIAALAGVVPLYALVAGVVLGVALLRDAR